MPPEVTGASPEGEAPKTIAPTKVATEGSAGDRQRPVRPLKKAEARALTEAIRETADNLVEFLAEAHERRAWRALGYGSWSEYVETEFSMTRSRAYQLLRHAEVMKALEVSTSVDTSALTEGQTRGADPEEVRRQAADGAPPEEAVRQAKPKGKPKPKGPSVPPPAPPSPEDGALRQFARCIDQVEHDLGEVAVLLQGDHGDVIRSNQQADEWRSNLVAARTNIGEALRSMEAER